MSVIHTYTLDTVTLRIEFTTSYQLENGKKVFVTPFYGENKGRRCKKIVHNSEAPYIWWNSQKVTLDNYDVLSPKAFVEKWKTRTLRFDEAMSVLERVDNFAIIFESNRGFTIFQKAATDTVLHSELAADLPVIKTYGLKGRSGGYRPLKLRKNTLYYMRKPLRALATELRYKTGCPVFLQKPIEEYKGKYLYVDDNYFLQETDKFPIEYLFHKRIQGWKDAGLKGTTNNQAWRDMEEIRTMLR